MRGSKPWQLIELFGNIWSQSYGGEVYDKTPRDFKHAKLYLQINDNEYLADVIVAKAKVYLRTNGYFAENRHNFTAFINNISSFVPPQSKPVKLWQCPQCQATMPESKQYNHPEECKKWSGGEEQKKEIGDMVSNLAERMRAK